MFVNLVIVESIPSLVINGRTAEGSVVTSIHGAIVVTDGIQVIFSVPGGEGRVPW